MHNTANNRPEAMKLTQFYSSTSAHVISILLTVVFTVSSASAKCTNGHEEPIVFSSSSDSSTSHEETHHIPRSSSTTLVKRGITEERKINLFHSPRKLPVITADRTYRLVEHTPSQVQRSNASDGDTFSMNTKKSIDANHSVSMQSAINLTNPQTVRRDVALGENETSYVRDNRLIEEFDGHSSSLDIPEDIRIQMDRLDPKQFFDTYVENELDDTPIDEYDGDADSKDEVSVSMLLRGSNSDSEGASTSRKKTPLTGFSQKTCTLEFRNVDLPRPDHVVLYYPMCVRVARCSGCCSSSRLKCTPMNITQKSVDVTHLKFNADRKKLTIAGIETFKFDQHEDCSCQCIQQAADCNEHQVYIPHECRCACRDQSKASLCVADARKIWLSDQCSCVCKQRSSCTTGTSFNEETCKCEIKRAPSLISALGLDNFGTIRISHSTFDVEFKKQQDFNLKSGAHDGGINTDDGNRKVTFF